MLLPGKGIATALLDTGSDINLVALELLEGDVEIRLGRTQIKLASLDPATEGAGVLTLTLVIKYNNNSTPTLETHNTWKLILQTPESFHVLFQTLYQPRKSVASNTVLEQDSTPPTGRCSTAKLRRGNTRRNSLRVRRI